MEWLTKVMNWELLSLGETSVTIGQLVAALVTVSIALILAAWLIRQLTKRLLKGDKDANLVQLIKKVLWATVITILFFTALGVLGVPLGAFAFISGAIAIGIGFGAQNIINNFISGWILMWERPIRIGDFLEVGGMLGTVETIKTRFTRIRRLDGVRLMVPNSQFLENTVINWTIVDRQLRSHVRVGVQYGSDVEKVKRLLDEILADNPDVLEDPAPTVIFEDFGDSALIFDAFFWIESTSERSLRGVRSALRFEIDRVFKEYDVVIAFPQRDVHVDGWLKMDKS